MKCLEYDAYNLMNSYIEGDEQKSRQEQYPCGQNNPYIARYKEQYAQNQIE